MVILAGTPIGDTASASPRLVQTLQGAQVIAAEDTRRLTDLLHRLQISTSARVVSYFEGNESARTPDLVEALRDGARVVLVTDAGMPSVSDPGYRLVAAAVEGAGLTVVRGSLADPLGRFVLATADLGPEDVVVFGDMPNDLPMLTWAGRSFAVANAHAEVLAMPEVDVAGAPERGEPEAEAGRPRRKEAHARSCVQARSSAAQGTAGPRSPTGESA